MLLSCRARGKHAKGVPGPSSALPRDPPSQELPALHFLQVWAGMGCHRGLPLGICPPPPLAPVGWRGKQGLGQVKPVYRPVLP